MSQTFLNPSDKDVLIFNTVLKVKSELLLTSTKEYGKKPCCTPSCTATLANSISCPSVVLTGDPIVGRGRSYPSNIEMVSITNAVYLENPNKEVLRLVHIFISQIFIVRTNGWRILFRLIQICFL